MFRFFTYTRRVDVFAGIVAARILDKIDIEPTDDSVAAQELMQRVTMRSYRAAYWLEREARRRDASGARVE